MGERWIINASPLILLAKAEVIELLPKLCDDLIIPAGVVREVEQGKLADAGSQEMAKRLFVLLLRFTQSLQLGRVGRGRRK